MTKVELIKHEWRYFKEDLPQPVHKYYAMVHLGYMKGDVVVMKADTEEALEYCENRWTSTLARLFMADVRWELA